MNSSATREASAKVDLYIAKSGAFAQPILHHIRSLVHKAAPDVEEAIKWSRPFFLHRGAILGNMAAFKQHCSLGFWGPDMASILKADGLETSESSGSFGRLTSVKDLPPDKVLLGYLRRAIALAESGTPGSKPAHMARIPKPELKPPPEFLAALKKNREATAAFDSLSPSCRREYIEWIAEAKRAETRDRRIEKAIAQIGERKSLHWKYA